MKTAVNYARIICIITLVFIIFLLCLDMLFNSPKSLEQVEYRTDIQPLVERFGKNVNITACFWKADTIGETFFGPTSYWIKGFALIEKDDLTSIVADYTLTNVTLQFEDGMNPVVTNCKDFSWHYSKELSREFTVPNFIGEIYVDINNGILYFDLESM